MKKTSEIASMLDIIDLLQLSAELRGMSAQMNVLSCLMEDRDSGDCHYGQPSMSQVIEFLYAIQEHLVRIADDVETLGDMIDTLTTGQKEEAAS